MLRRTRSRGESVAARPVEADALALFSVMWALAAVWHVLGNPGGAPPAAQGLIAVGIGLVLWRPGAVAPLGVLAAGGLATLWGEAPVIGNHWLLAGFVDLAILVAIAAGALRRRPLHRADLANRFFPVARLCLLTFYSLAAFSKLNAAFFDPSVSCGVFFFNEWTSSVGLAGLQQGGARWAAWAAIVGTATVELSIPVLLVVRRTRSVGVLVALVFHSVLAIDRTHQFFDFSSVLVALFVFFLPSDIGPWVVERVGSVRARLLLRDERLPQRVHLALVGFPTALAAGCALGVINPLDGFHVGWPFWQLYAVVVVLAARRFIGRRSSVPAHAFRPTHVLLLLVPALVVLNGLTPYLEVKTAYAWNMYSNLRTVDGDSNHFIVRRSFPLTDEQAELVRIIDTDSPDLARYASNDYALTWTQLRAYLAEHPDVRITYYRGPNRVVLPRAADRPDLVEPVATWRQKLLLFRPVDLRSPERCVPTFGPAR